MPLKTGFTGAHWSSSGGTGQKHSFLSGVHLRKSLVQFWGELQCPAQADILGADRKIWALLPPSQVHLLLENK